ncbi:hypothetical protein FEM54_21740 [Pseudomonas edaphica]|uniref:Uncharacterized protein n=1 Tax=Pseudomonas edaphica TaxID=2006980 RepID=A0ABY2U0Z8_9PSED|nr:hypothetical protein FEM54_21740 [Pseudomonas edaphica]
MGAGLPAVQTTRSVPFTEAMLSQASQLPQKPAPAGELWVIARPAAGTGRSLAGGWRCAVCRLGALWPPPA